MSKYLMRYTLDEFPRDTRTKIVEGPPNMTWRECQQRFDPSYWYNSLHFWELGKEIVYTEKT